MTTEKEWYPCPCCDGNGGATSGPLPNHQKELEAAFEIIESLPVDPHDMEVHYWCPADWGCEDEE